MKKHIAVIGAGAFGSWTAYFLRRQGAKVTLFDAWGPGNSRSSSGGESRIIRSVYGPDRIYVEMVAKAFRLWKDFEDEWNVALYLPAGSLWMFSQRDDQYLKTSLPHLKEFGFRVEQLSNKDIQKRYPVINTGGIHAAYFEPVSGLLYAAKACQKVVEAFVQKGGDYRQLEVRPGQVRNGLMESVRLSDGTDFSADEYVFACGPWIRQLFSSVLGSGLFISRQEVFFFGTPAGENGYRHPQLPIWLEFGEELYYGLPSRNLRGFKVAEDIRTIAFDPDHDDRLASAERLAAARGFLSRRFPGLAGAPVVESRVCQYCNSPDGHFILDRHPEAANTWIAGAGTGHGFKLGPAVGQYLSDRILEGTPGNPLFSIQGKKQARGFSQFKA